MWRHERLPIVIKLKESTEADDRDQTAMIKPDRRSSQEDTWTMILKDWLDRTVAIRHDVGSPWRRVEVSGCVDLHRMVDGR